MLNTTNEREKFYLATAGGIAAILLWSTTVAFARSLSEQLGPMTAAAGVYSVSGVVALASLLRGRRQFERTCRLPARYLVGCGALFVGYTLLLFLAIGWADSRQQVLEIGLLNYLWPALTLVLSLVLLGRRANWMLLPGTLSALAGVFLVVTQGATVSWNSFYGNFSSNLPAYSSALAAAILWAMYSNLTRRWARGQTDGAVGLFLPLTAAALLLVCCVVDEPREWSRRALVETLFLGAATFAAYTLWDAAMRKGNVVLVASASYLTPLLSTVVSCIYLAVLPGGRLWVGCGVLVVGSLLSWHSISSASNRRVPQPADAFEGFPPQDNGDVGRADGQ